MVFTNTGTVGTAFSNCFDRGSILTSTVFDDFLESANDGGTVTYLWVPVRVIPGQWVSTFQYCTVQYCSSDLQYCTVQYCDIEYSTVLYCSGFLLYCTVQYCTVVLLCSTVQYCMIWIVVSYSYVLYSTIPGHVYRIAHITFCDSLLLNII